MSQRDDFTSANDYVFVNRLGRRLDGSALRRRVERARDDLASVKAAMGHSRITTTERYLHARVRR